MSEFVRVKAVTPKVFVGDVHANTENIVSLCTESKDADIIVFPELCLTGYTCGDLFFNKDLLRQAEAALFKISSYISGYHGLAIIGCPITVNGSLYNCAVVIDRTRGRILGIVPKQFLPNYKEFYERRWFTPANGTEPKMIEILHLEVNFGTDLLFKICNDNDILIGIEICEDLWCPIPPSSYQALAGANVLVNLSASNETVGKADYRRSLVVNQSARCMAAYIYCSAGVHESTSDLVFSGHSIISENGSILMESDRFQRDNYSIQSDVNLVKLNNERIKTSSFADSKRLVDKEYRIIEYFDPSGSKVNLPNIIYPKIENPFVPLNDSNWDKRCDDIFNIQVSGLIKRIESANIKDLYIGVSGGLDSTLALLVANQAACILDSGVKIHGVTMPGFGTSNRTKSNAIDLMESLNIAYDKVDIKQLAYDTFISIGHKPFGIDISNETLESFTEKLKTIEHPFDPTFENTQARIRTLILMNKGFVLGTGDMSELALGWATYNGDHMSMYNVNCSIPKTLVKELVRWFMSCQPIQPSTRNILKDILDTEISPELLPVNGEKIQSTEDYLGPYQLHDLFMFYFVRYNYSLNMIYQLVCRDTNYHPDFIKTCLKRFIERFFNNQFKRNCVPDGPKVGSVSLSPRGDWRMPSDADKKMFLNILEKLEYVA